MALKIDSLVELRKLLKLCHEQNVRSITIDGITMQLEPQDSEVPKQADQKLDSEQPQYTDEDLLMWSAGEVLNG